MKRSVVVALVCGTLSLTAFGQVADSPSDEEVRRLLQLIGAKQNMQLMLDGMKQQMKAGAQQGFKSKVPKLTTVQLQHMDALIDDVFSEIAVDELVSVIVPIYQRHLTRSDLKGITDFYTSPVGQKVLHQQPAMMQESMQVSSQLMESRMKSLMGKIDARMEELMGSTLGSSQPPSAK